MDLHQVRTVLLDIEGTLCPITFVKEVLFPYALSTLSDVLAENWDEPGFKPYRDAFPPDVKTSPEALEAHVRDIAAKDLKVAYLKNLQGYLWRTGYESRAYTTPLFADVVPRLQEWHAAGIQLAIFSSGSVAAQKLLFQHVGVDVDREEKEPVTTEDHEEGGSYSRKRKFDTSHSLRSAKSRRTVVGDDGIDQDGRRNDGPLEHKDVLEENQDDEEGGKEETQTKAQVESNGKVQDAEVKQETKDSKEKEDESPPQKTPQPPLRDLTHIFDGFFDTVNAGPKTEKESYVKIAAGLLRKCEEVLFLSDNANEIRASLAANMPSLLIIRPGNAPLSDADKADLTIISSLDEVQDLPTINEQ